MRLAATVLGLVLLGACGGDGKAPPLRQMSMSYSYTIAPDHAPPHARTDVHYTVTIFDRKTREPIEDGEGQLFASDADHDKTWDSFTYGPEIGTYHAKVNFIMPGTWAVAIRFRRDSLHPLERIDWMQDVLNDTSSVP